MIITKNIHITLKLHCTELISQMCYTLLALDYINKRTHKICITILLL